MKLILAMSLLLTSSLASAGAVTHIVAPEHVPTYINPDHVVIQSTTVPWSFDMVGEPSILPIIPEVAVKSTVVEGVTITEYNLSSDVLFAFDKDYVDEENHVFAPITGAWIETIMSFALLTSVTSHPSRVRGLKLSAY